MDLDLTPDQAGLLDAVGKLVASFATQPAGAAQDFLVSQELEDRLTKSGFREVATVDGMGVLDAVLLIWFPQLVLKRGYGLHDVVIVTSLSALIMAVRAARIAVG